MDRYRCFDELRKCESEGRDYRIRLHHGKSCFAIMAPHGGKIERGTSRLAESIAGNEHTFYSFEGVKDKNNYHLHITSDRFDEPKALLLAGQVHTVITIHGAGGQDHEIYTGGLDLDLEQQILGAFNNTGFTARHDPSPTRQGLGVTNICNRGYGARGVQLELTQGLRKHLFNPAGNGANWVPNDLFYVFVLTLRIVLEKYSGHGPCNKGA
jgi:phage replication-related protein YjqB (UPF0714/DUF867 family)